MQKKAGMKKKKIEPRMPKAKRLRLLGKIFEAASNHFYTRLYEQKS